MRRLRVNGKWKRGKRALARKPGGRGRFRHVTKAGPGRFASHKRRPAGTKVARMLARAR